MHWPDILGHPTRNAFNVHSIIGLLFGDHSTISILFVIPEAVGAINGHNAAILTELQKLGRVDAITQADALNYPHFAEYNIVVCGTDNGTAWVAANLAHVKEFPEPVICVDATVAAYLLIGTDGGDAAAKTVLTAIAEIKANDLGIGIEGLTGLAVGANTISSATVYNTIDMSAASITETFFGTETVADNTDVLLAAVFKRQADSTRGILSDGSEATGSRYFYGPAYSAADLNTLGLAVVELICHMAIQSTTAAVGVEISGDIGDLETKLFGNQASEFNNGNPLVEFLAGRNSSGTKLAVGVSLPDMITTLTALVDSAQFTGPMSYLDAGGEQTVRENILGTRRRVWLNFSSRNMTQTGTFRVYFKVDGANYDLYAEQPVTVGAGDERAFDAEFTVNQDWKLTYEEDVNEGAARDIPYNVIMQAIE